MNTFPYIDLHTHTAAAERTDSIPIESVRLSTAAPPLPPSGLFSAGIHPWDAPLAQQEWLQLFENHPDRLIAVGEVGLDLRPLYRTHQAAQTEWFERQIELANRLSKPLIIHCVHATEAVSRILVRTARVPAILHGFTGSVTTLRQWLGSAADVRFSFGPRGLLVPQNPNPKAQQAQQALQALQFLLQTHPDRLFLETDADPTQRNPAPSIERIYEAASAATACPIAELRQLIYQNFTALFPF